MPRRNSATIFAIFLLVTLVTGGLGLGAEPKKKKLVPVPLPLLPVVQEWIATLDDAPTAGGAMDAERVYVPIEVDRIVALSRASGAKLWMSGVESKWPPVVIGESLYVAASDEIHALVSETGESKWRVPFERPMIAPLVATATSLVGTFDKGLVIAFTPDTGRTLWMRELGAPSRFAPAFDDTHAFFALDDSRVVAVRLADGRVDWEQKLEGVLSQPSFSHDRVFVGSNMNRLFAIDNNNGRLAWTWKTGGDVIGTSGDVKGGAYYASLDNVLRAVNRSNGNQRWIKEIPTRPLLPPRTFGDGVLYEEIIVLTGVTSEIDAFGAKTGALAGTYMPPSDLEGEPLIDPVLRPYEVAMVVITRDGRVIGLKPSAMMLPEPLETPLMSDMPGRRLERERITPATR